MSHASEQAKYTPTQTDDDKCPDDATDICKEFMEKSVFKWSSWVADANSALYSCCGVMPPEAPSPPDEDCDEQDSCKDVCKMFRSWAKDIRKWAIALTHELEECFEEWDSEAAVPSVPKGCNQCESLCERIRTFHKQLATWGKGVAVALNDICPAPPNRVDPPPPPPFE